MGFATTKQVIIPLLKLVENVAVIVTITSEFFTGKKVDDKKEAAILCRVADPATGETYEMIANTVFRSTLEEAYPKGSYVGKTFQITKLPAREGKNYNGFKILEGTYTPEPPAAVAAAPVSGQTAVSGTAPANAGAPQSQAGNGTNAKGAKETAKA